MYKYFHLRTTIYVLIFVFFGAITNSKDMENAISAMNAGQHEKAAKLYETLAKNGDPLAQHNLAVMYERGLYFKVSYKDAFFWYERAAKSGLQQALFQIGNMYHFGRGVEKNLKKAVEKYLLAANKGSADAHNQLADLYTKGEYFELDESKALFHSVQAVNINNDKHAAYNVGYSLFHGKGVSINLAEAFKYFVISAEAGHPIAMYYVGNFFDAGLAGKRIDKKLAAYWYEKSSSNGYKVSKHNLANMHLKGEGVRRDSLTAFKLFKEAAYLGFPKSQLMLSILYNAGEGIDIDKDKAVMWFLIAEMNGTANKKVTEMILENIDKSIKEKILERAKDCLFSGYKFEICD